MPRFKCCHRAATLAALQRGWEVFGIVMDLTDCYP
jgi:hypothetical protein